MRKDRFFTPLEKVHPVRKILSNGVEEQSSLTGFTEKMPIFLIESKEIIHKITKVLRKKEGSPIFFFDGKGKEYSAQIKAITPKKITFEHLKITKTCLKDPLILTLAFSLLKSNKADFVLQKSTELGIDRIIPFVSKNTSVTYPGKAKLTHWQKILVESASQSQRDFIPKLNSPLKLPEILNTADKDYSLILTGDPEASLSAGKVLSIIDREKINDILLLSGPEGGFAKEETEMFKKTPNLRLVKLSNFILRAETAAVFLTGLASHILNKNG